MTTTRMGGIQAVVAELGDIHDGTVTAGQLHFHERSRSATIFRSGGATARDEAEFRGGASMRGQGASAPSRNQHFQAAMHERGRLPNTGNAAGFIEQGVEVERSVLLQGAKRGQARSFAKAAKFSLSLFCGIVFTIWMKSRLLKQGGSVQGAYWKDWRAR